MRADDDGFEAIVELPLLEDDADTEALMTFAIPKMVSAVLMLKQPT